MDLPIARRLFYREISRPDAEINLGRAALYIAQEEYPSLSPEEYLNALDVMAAEVEERLSDERYPLRVIQTINRYLFEDLGFTGNTQDYYDPRNSFLNEVIERRTGIPITLSLVYLEVARRIDFPMVGIGMPGHFLIRPDFEGAGIFIDAFNKGEVLFPEDCAIRLAQIYNHPVELKPEFLAPVSNRHFLGRMLSNLKLIYLNRGELLKSLAAVERILLLFPKAAIELRWRGLLYYQLGYWQEASQDLNTYLQLIPDAKDAEIIRQLLKQIDFS